MRDATPELESILEYCKMILNTDSPHSVDAILDEIPTILRDEAGYSDEQVEYFMAQLNNTLTLIDNEELVFNEEGRLVPGPNAIQEEMESGTLQPIDENLEHTNTVVGSAAIGLSIAALIACASIRKQINKNTRNRHI
ncbi:MAG: hypothetical protein K2G03_01280 [Bacilli bacterium]|nr:hypothetical protein [Bacilli bacterium]